MTSEFSLEVMQSHLPMPSMPDWILLDASIAGDAMRLNLKPSTYKTGALPPSYETL